MKLRNNRVLQNMICGLNSHKVLEEIGGQHLIQCVSFVVCAGAFSAHRFSFHRVETLTGYGAFAIPTNETGRMPLGIQRRDVILHDRPIATAAFRREILEIVLLAVGFAIFLVKALRTEFTSAFGAGEVLRMPSLVQGCDAFIEHG